MRLFVDTGAWFAYVNAGDPDHAAVVQVLEHHDLITSNFVLDEFVTLLRMRQGHAPAVRAGHLLRTGDIARVVRISVQDEDEAWALFEARSDKQYSFTDCTSFAIMRRLGLQHAATTDEDFRREGFEVLPNP